MPTVQSIPMNTRANRSLLPHQYQPFCLCDTCLLGRGVHEPITRNPSPSPVQWHCPPLLDGTRTPSPQPQWEWEEELNYSNEALFSHVAERQDSPSSPRIDLDLEGRSLSAFEAPGSVGHGHRHGDDSASEWSMSSYGGPVSPAMDDAMGMGADVEALSNYLDRQQQEEYEHGQHHWEYRQYDHYGEHEQDAGSDAWSSTTTFVNSDSDTAPVDTTAHATPIENPLEYDSLRDLTAHLASQQEGTNEQMELIHNLLCHVAAWQYRDAQDNRNGIESLRGAIESLRGTVESLSRGQVNTGDRLADSENRLRQAALDHAESLRSLGFHEEEIANQQEQLLWAPRINLPIRHRSLSEIDPFFDINDEECLPVFDGERGMVHGWLTYMDAILEADQAYSRILLSHNRFPDRLVGRALQFWNCFTRQDQEWLLSDWQTLKDLFLEEFDG